MSGPPPSSPGVSCCSSTGRDTCRRPGNQTGPEALAQAIAAEIGRPVSYRPVEADGAARAAALLAELI